MFYIHYADVHESEQTGGYLIHNRKKMNDMLIRVFEQNETFKRFYLLMFTDLNGDKFELIHNNPEYIMDAINRYIGDDKVVKFGLIETATYADALAILCNSERVGDLAEGVEMTADELIESIKNGNMKMGIEDLHKLLTHAEDNEDYELCGVIKREIEKLK